mmetsp:Transcript_1944/g.4191  ORF Transcript_1944/g.4191 Transcript_1944/m.4191 type:complete len:92 (-) Transcript_1944:209-484(-)
MNIRAIVMLATPSCVLDLTQPRLLIKLIHHLLLAALLAMLMFANLISINARFLLLHLCAMKVIQAAVVLQSHGWEPIALRVVSCSKDARNS